MRARERILAMNRKQREKRASAPFVAPCAVVGRERAGSILPGRQAARLAHDGGDRR